MFIVLLGNDISQVPTPLFWQGFRARWNAIVNSCIHSALDGKIFFKSEKQLMDYYQGLVRQGAAQQTVSQ